MNRTIEQLRSGRYEYTTAPPHLSERAVRLSGKPGIDVRGSFTVTSGDGQRMKGSGFVTNARIVLSQDHFSGSSFTVEYGIDVKGLRGGDAVRGEILLMLSTGEVHVPVELTLLESAVSTGETVLRTPSDLARIARYDRVEAFRIFSGEGYGKLTEEDPKAYGLYRALTANPVTYQRMEEFLVVSGWKEPVRFSQDKMSEKFDHVREGAQGTLRITKSTWGHVNLTARAYGSFLTLPQKHFVEDDFVGNVLDLKYLINGDLLGEGISKGRIEIDSDTDHLTLLVEAVRRSPEGAAERISRKKAMSGILHDLLDFRLEKTDGTLLARRIVPRISNLRKASESKKIVLDLLEAYVYLLVGARKAALTILRQWEGHDFGEEMAAIEAVHLYLCSTLGMRALEKEELVEEIRTLYAEDENSLVMLLILLRIDPDYQMRPGKVLSKMSRMYREGVRSPFLFLEAALLLNSNVHLLGTLTPFAKNTLLFAIRYDLLGKDLALKSALLSENEKAFTPAVYRILSISYDRFGMDDMLSAVCRLIMKGNPRREVFHKWYALAIERDIRLTRLYEYYMETLPDNYRKALPLKVRRYFTMNTTLGAGKRALLYANIILNRAYDRATYEEYGEAMDAFAEEMLLRGSINEDFAILYSDRIRTLKTKAMAEAMARIMFRHVIVCDDPRIREVIVVHGALREEEVYPIYHGRAYADIFTEDAVIVFRDEKGRRFVSGVPYSAAKLLEYDSYMDAARKFGVEEKGCMLHTVSALKGAPEETPTTLEERMYIIFSDEFTDGVRRETTGELLTYFAKYPEEDTLDYFLSRITRNPAAEENHTLLIEIMVMRGLYRDAWALALRYGYDEIDDGLLVRLVCHMISITDYAADEELLLACAELFRKGVFEERTLSYLGEFFEGSFSDLLALRKEMAAQHMECKAVDERILLAGIFTRTDRPETEETLKAYMEEGGEKRIIEAALIFEAQRSFLGGKTLSGTIAALLYQAIEGSTLRSDLCELALLRHYLTDKAELTPEESSMADRLFEDAVERGYLFSFFEKVAIELREQYALDDKYIFEYKGLPTDKVVLRIRGSEDNGWNLEVPMRHMLGGIHTAPVMLFAGEVVSFRTIVYRNGERIENAEERVVMTTKETLGRSRYQRINKLILADRGARDEEFRETERKLRLALHTVDVLFPLPGSTAGKEEP